MFEPALQPVLRPVAARETLPTMYDLPSEEIGDAGMPDEFHAHQATLLNETFQPPGYWPDNYYSAIDMNLYYDARQPFWYKRPDWFGVIGVPRFYERRDMRLSYVVWQEQVVPLIVVELLSPGTEKEDLGQTQRGAAAPPVKWEVYEQILRIPYYAVFSYASTELHIFRHDGQRFTEVLNHGGRFWLPEAALGLGLWQGRYHGADRLWARWYDAQGRWIPTDEERAEQEHQRAEQAHQHAEQEHQRAERLAEMLRQLGRDPNQL